MRARPVLPLPSVKGWIVSNWACAIAACARGSISRRFMKAEGLRGAAGTRS